MKLQDFSLSILNKRRTSQRVNISSSASTEAGSVGGTTDFLPDTFIVLVGHLDVDIALSINSVLDKVLAVIVVDNLAGDSLRLLFTSFDSDLEFIAT